MKKEKEVCTFYIVRHGETDHNVNKITYGHSESLLTENGIKQAEEIRDKFRNIKFDAIFSSDLSRTQRTAEIIRLDKNLDIQISPLLRERFYGTFEGKPTAEFKESLGDKIKESEKLSEAEFWKFNLSEDIENDEELVARFTDKLNDISSGYLGKNVLIVSHGGCMRVFLLKMEYAERAKLRYGFFKNLGYMKVISDGHRFVIMDVVSDPS